MNDRLSIMSNKKPSNPQIQRKIANLIQKNEKLENEIKSLEQEIFLQNKESENITNNAHELNNEKAKIEENILNEEKRTRLFLQNFSDDFDQKEEFLKNERKKIKMETINYTKKAESTANEIFKLQNQINREYRLLKITMEQELLELHASENELHKLEKQEAHLIKLLCQRVKGVPSYPPSYSIDKAMIIQSIHENMMKRDKKYQLDKQISSLQQLKQQFEAEIKILEESVNDDIA